MKLNYLPITLGILCCLFFTNSTAVKSYSELDVIRAFENCEMSVQSKVRYGVQRKMVDGNAFSNVQLGDDLNADHFTDGMLEVCISPKTGCKWNLTSNGTKAEDNISIEFKGLEDVVKTLKFSDSQSNVSTKDFIEVAKNNGAEISDLGNGAMSIRQINPVSNLTTVTLVDTNKNVIMGSSVYGDGNQLKAKMICKYKGTKEFQAIHTLSLLVFEHAMGDKSGWMTEIIACY